jgi:hypothetical protein
VDCESINATNNGNIMAVVHFGSPHFWKKCPS